MGVLIADVDLELLQLLTTQAVFGEHSSDGLFDGANWVLFQQVGVADAAEPTRVSGVAVSTLLAGFLTGENYLVSVHNDDVVSHIHVGGEGGLVLAAEQNGSVASEATENHVCGVDNQPVALNVRGGGTECTRHANTNRVEEFVYLAPVTVSRKLAGGGLNRRAQDWAPFRNTTPPARLSQFEGRLRTPLVCSRRAANSLSGG